MLRKIDIENIALFGFSDLFLFVNEEVIKSCPEAKKELFEWLGTWGKKGKIKKSGKMGKFTTYICIFLLILLQGCSNSNSWYNPRGVAEGPKDVNYPPHFERPDWWPLPWNWPVPEDHFYDWYIERDIWEVCD